MTPWKDDYKAYSEENAKLINEVLDELYKKGVRGRYVDKTYSVHIFGLGAWISRNLDRTEQFIFACRNLRAALREERQLTASLKRQLMALAGTEEIVDLGSKRNFAAFYGNLFRGFMVPDSQADALVSAINAAIDKASRYGFTEGSSVLRRLAVGDMSVTDFEKVETEKGV